ncbi:aldehyde dehydrogenase family protein [Sphingopyxis panaciterrulae]|uniref:Aldehyde dehydrogenase (NAD+) n=1 Tax=Sphingopyxis panaciterrulae TaxID=462372 RepID=A0A7W9B635_9SPHN|nr:aldehyde dehydrogenase family protein [Sphingopyxis panaciterrulae]MBB5706960.1 aldehyde dehydrogenase (NAD+) [Sphingopyxis panaciterrulae]
MNADDIYTRVPTDMEDWLARLDLRMTIGGRDAPAGATGTVVHACTERPIARYPDADAGHVDAAVRVAAAAFPAWAATPWGERRACLERFADALRTQSDTLALIVAAEAGRPLRRAWGEVAFSADYVRMIAGQRLPDKAYRRAGLHAVLKHRPLGVVGAIAPWNGPVILAIAKIANALIAGDTLILRPSPFTPLSALYLGRMARDIFPAGVLNVITGDASVGAAMTTHPGIAKISFTGSTATGKRIAAAAAPTLKRLTLELGGNDAAIVLADADPAAVAETVYRISLENAGQFCAAIKRLYVHESLYDSVRDAIVRRAGAAVAGSCFRPETTMTPVQNRAQFDRVWSLFDDAVAGGGRVAVGGERHRGEGLFIPPTLVEGVGAGVRLVDEEQFGPVLPIIAFRDEAAAIAQANCGPYGLGGSIWTRDVDRGLALAERLDAGTGWVNQHGAFTAALPMPFAGESGIGMDYAEYGVAEHSQAMLINALLPSSADQR